MKLRKKRHLKIGDKVKVITGTQKGVIGIVESIETKKQLVTVDTLPSRTKYMKSQDGNEAKKVDLPIPIHISNVMLWDEKATIASKISWKIVDGKKQRYFRKSGNIVEN